MLHFLSFIISWLFGMLAILISAFFSYDQFSIIDITSFAVMTFIGFLLTFLIVYVVVLKTINRKVAMKQFIYYPLIFSLSANLPVYLLIWINKGNYYGQGEATLFTIGFFVSGLAFGLFWAWKNKMIEGRKDF